MRGVVTVSDDELRDAMRFAFERMKLVVEPSGAAALAALLHGRIPELAGKRVGASSAAGTSTPLATLELTLHRACTMFPQATYLPKSAALSCTLMAYVPPSSLIDRYALDGRRRVAVDDAGQRIGDAFEFRAGSVVNVRRLRRRRRRAFERDDDLDVGAAFGLAWPFRFRRTVLRV